MLPGSHNGNASSTFPRIAQRALLFFEANLQNFSMTMLCFAYFTEGNLEIYIFARIFELWRSGEQKPGLKSIDKRQDSLLFSLSALFALRVPNTRSVF